MTQRNDQLPKREPPAAYPQELVDDTIDLRRLLSVLRKRWLGIAAVFAVVVVAAGLFTIRQTPVYQASTSLIIDPVMPRILQEVSDVVEVGAGRTWQTREFYETEYEVIRSRAISRTVVEKLGLANDLEFLGLADIEDQDELAERLKRIDPVERLRSRISVKPVQESRMVQVAVRDVDPRRAALLSGEVADAYITQNLSRRTMGTSDAIEWLDEQMSDLRPRLEASEVALHEFRREHDMLSTSLEDRQNILSQRIQTLNATLTELRTNRVKLETRVERIRSLKEVSKNAGRPAYDSLAVVSRSQVIERLKQQYFSKVHEYAALEERYLEKHPRLLQAGEALEAARRNLDEEIDKIIASVENEYLEARDAERRIQQLINEETARAHEVGRKEIAYTPLLREKVENERLYELVQSRMKEAGLMADQRTNNIRLVDPAVVPTRPVSPRVRRNMALSVVLGLFFGVGVAFLREVLDNTVGSPDDIESELGIPLLGIMPEVEERHAGEERADLHVLDNGRAPLAEACRSIRTNLMFMSTDKPLGRLLVTSAGPKEGKTSMVVDLGIVMAQSGAKVVLVDTDMRKPRLHRAFGVRNEQGLSSILVGAAGLDDVLVQTEVEGLYLLTCGPIPPNPAELLHTGRFNELLQALDERFDRIILDSPPLGAVADAKVLSTVVDGTLLVIKARQTPKNMVRHAVDSVEDVGARLLGAVLSRVDLSKREYGEYYYYYYRRYGGYYGDEAEKSS